MSASRIIDVVLEPPVPWTIASQPDRFERRRTLESFGLDPDRPVVVVGHQPTFWHAGILAKFLAADALVERCNGQLVHLVIDGHRGRFGHVAWPQADDEGGLRSVTWQFRSCDEHHAMGTQPACPPSPCPGDAPEGLGRIGAALQEFADASDAAWQHAEALNRLMDPVVGPRTTITTTELMASPSGTMLLDRMVDDAEACRAKYNAAVASDPTLGIARLESGELPMWSVDDQLELRTSRVTDPKGVRRFPKALWTTALARLGLGDCFIHGVGGGRYDVFMEQWIQAWLQEQPCPMFVASASVLLPLGTAEQWRAMRQMRIAEARRRRHDPAVLRGSGPSSAKAAMLQEIDDLPVKSSERRAAFRRMHDTLRGHPAAGVGVLADEEQRRLAQAQQIATDRTWAFPLHDAEALQQLRTEVRSRFGS